MIPEVYSSSVKSFILIRFAVNWDVVVYACSCICVRVIIMTQACNVTSTSRVCQCVMTRRGMTQISSGAAVCMHSSYMVWHDITWCGMAWHSMAWHGVAWRGMAWHGMA